MDSQEQTQDRAAKRKVDEIATPKKPASESVEQAPAEAKISPPLKKIAIEPTDGDGEQENGQQDTEIERTSKVKKESPKKDSIKTDSPKKVASTLSLFGGGSGASWDDWTDDAPKKPAVTTGSDKPGALADPGRKHLPAKSVGIPESPLGALSSHSGTDKSSQTTGGSTSIFDRLKSATSLGTTTFRSFAGPTFGSSTSSYSGLSFGSQANKDDQSSFSSLLSSQQEDSAEADDVEAEAPIEIAPVVSLELQEVVTGEEDEKTLFQTRCKLFHWKDQKWCERGTGSLRVNAKRDSIARSRLVMRSEGVLRLILNTAIYNKMPVEQYQGRYVRFAAFETDESGTTTLTRYLVKVANDDAGKELVKAVVAASAKAAKAE
ncbi:uncharacterized protein BJ171DRAFT_597987 [Polychytrium aggregatum]|uniref:uncharacterized protein n=1 Tax=Polychytrium aggregatum TaxID=110093 RepID=UPI0022FE524A|nr:uncharacterized protein BJ171DRAFT_597987 [Polychytrium aggregatum]KAI9205785.1 hypothetical protein BJ171DRAFT_597987 [Polychytrium aggregatum]